jgi:error-prone DNA polymerase
MTLEDETGFVNLVIWKPIFERYAVLARLAGWLGVTGTVQAQDDVVHVIAEALWTPDALEPRNSSSHTSGGFLLPRTVSRDFH